jgi:hypothetical protein
MLVWSRDSRFRLRGEGRRIERRTENPIKLCAVPEAVKEAEIDEDWRDEDDSPGDGDGGVAGMQSVRDRDDHFEVELTVGGC